MMDGLRGTAPNLVNMCGSRTTVRGPGVCGTRPCLYYHTHPHLYSHLRPCFNPGLNPCLNQLNFLNACTDPLNLCHGARLYPRLHPRHLC